MITVIGNESNRLYYRCDCGAKGMCTVKPADKDTALVIDVRCPMCGEVERITLLQYSTDEAKEDILRNLKEIDLSWVPYFNEEINGED